MQIHESAEEIRRLLKKDDEVKVSVALFGQPGSGKSSLINKIVGRRVADVGVETDKTTEETAYEHNGIHFVDLPGYDTEGFPKETYFDRLNNHRLKPEG